MKKFVLFQLIWALLFSSIFTISCSDDDDDDDEPRPAPVAPSLNITDLNFDSSTFTLTAKTTVTAGISVRAICNSMEVVAVVANGDSSSSANSLSWNLENAFSSNSLGGKAYSITFMADDYPNQASSITYYPQIKYEINCPSEIEIFQSDAQTFTSPTITVKNYVDGAIKVDSYYTVSGDETHYSLADFKTKFASDSFYQNGDNTAEFHYKLYLNGDENGSLVSPISEKTVTIYCSQAESDTDLHITELSFDSKTLTLTAKTTFAIEDTVGAAVTAKCNGHSETAYVVDGDWVDGPVRRNYLKWNMAQAFHDGILGGKNYQVEFSASGKTSQTKTISYYPPIKYKLNSPEEIVVFSEQADSLTDPEIVVTNYDETALKKESLYVILNPYVECNLEGFKNHLKTADFFQSDDTAEAYYMIKIAPKNLEDTSEAKEAAYENGLWIVDSVKFQCRRQILVRSVKAVQKNRLLTAYNYADDTPSETNTDAAGGNISYQWQRSATKAENSWEDISGATQKTYTLQNSDAGNYFRVKIVQIWIDRNDTSKTETLPPVYSEPTDLLNNGFDTSKISLKYNGVITAGNAPDGTKITGTLTDITGNTIDASDVTFTSTIDYIPKVSKYFTFKVSKDGYEDATVSVYAIVQAVLTEAELPTLSTNTDEIDVGKVSFSYIDSDIEYYRNYSHFWQELPLVDFTASSGDVLHFRKKAVGTANTEGYIKESDELTVTVKAENEGKKTSAGGLIDEIKITKLKLVKSDDGSNIKIKPVVENEELYEYQYSYIIDDVEYTSSEYASAGIFKASSDNTLFIPHGALKSGDVYQISCSAIVYAENGNVMKVLSANYSLSL